MADRRRHRCRAGPRARTAAPAASTAKEEERRLFHVAVTRAQHELQVTWYGAEPSPFLAPVDLLVEPRRRRLRPSPSASAGPGAEPVLAALQAWRRDVARAARVDVTAVVDDRTLVAIAAARPTNIESLAAVAGFGPLMARRHGARLLAVIGPAVAPTASP